MILKTFKCSLIWLFFSIHASEIKTPGHLETLNTLIAGVNQKLSELKDKALQTPSSSFIPAQIETIKLHPDFLFSLGFFSPHKFVRAASKNHCSRLLFFEQGLLKTTPLMGSDVIVVFKNKNEDQEKLAVISKENFFKIIYTKDCASNLTVKERYQPSRIKSTLGGDFIPPKDEKNCAPIFDRWRDSQDLASLCSLSKEQKSAMGALQVKLDTEICRDHQSAREFCDSFFKDTFWGQEKNANVLTNLCKKRIQKSNPSKIEISECKNVFTSQPDSCQGLSTPGQFEIPLQSNCKVIEKAVKNSRLDHSKADCSEASNSGELVNAHRILQFFSPKMPLATPEGDCLFQTAFSSWSLFQKFNRAQSWPLLACYPDPFSEREVCLPFVPGESNKSDQSQTSVVAEILKKSKAAPKNLTCQRVSERVFNPMLLNFKQGCFITYDPLNCTTTHCPERIYWENKLQKNISFKRGQVIHYFPNLLNRNQQIFSDVLTSSTPFKSRRLLNFGILQNFLNSNPQGLAHGIACAADLLPKVFSMTRPGECWPMPFIVSGTFTEDGITYLVMQLSSLELLNPLVATWADLINAITNFQLANNLDYWPLEGVSP